jgi:hypothetical protein
MKRKKIPRELKEEALGQNPKTRNHEQEPTNKKQRTRLH